MLRVFAAVAIAAAAAIIAVAAAVAVVCSTGLTSGSWTFETDPLPLSYIRNPILSVSKAKDKTVSDHSRMDILFAIQKLNTTKCKRVAAILKISILLVLQTLYRFPNTRWVCWLFYSTHPETVLKVLNSVTFQSQGLLSESRLKTITQRSTEWKQCQESTGLGPAFTWAWLSFPELGKRDWEKVTLQNVWNWGLADWLKKPSEHRAEGVGDPKDQQSPMGGKLPLSLDPWVEPGHWLLST